MTHLFDGDGQSPTSYKLGGSAIYAVTRDFNLMLEALGEWEETVNDLREIERQFTFTINPGFRTAVNFRDDSQLVMGFSVPIVLTKGSAPDYGLFFYLSYEHDFLPKRNEEIAQVFRLRLCRAHRCRMSRSPLVRSPKNVRMLPT